jgi:hypothetical protein
LQAHVRRCGFAESQRQDISDLLDRLACDVEARARIFEAIDAKPVSPVEKATTLLKLCIGGILTEGKLSARARELVMGYLSRPGFLTGYIAQAAANGHRPTAADAMAELLTTLGRAGIAAETGLRNIAA